MRVFKCKHCGWEFGWVLGYKALDVCVYCIGHYEDGTKAGTRKDNFYVLKDEEK